MDFELLDDAILVPAMSSYMAAKCECGDKLELLSPEEAVFYRCDQLAAAGSFTAFLAVTARERAEGTPEALEMLGAPKTAALLRRALESEGDALAALDGEWFETGEYLDVLCAAYVRAHADAFS